MHKQNIMTWKHEVHENQKKLYSYHKLEQFWWFFIFPADYFYCIYEIVRKIETRKNVLLEATAHIAISNKKYA